MWVCVHECRCPEKLGARSLGASTTDGYELPDVGTGTELAMGLFIPNISISPI